MIDQYLALILDFSGLVQSFPCSSKPEFEKIWTVRNIEKPASCFNKNRVKYILGALVLGEIADGALTNILIKMDIGHEGNPFLVNIAGKSGFMVLKIAGALLAAVILWDISRRYPRLAFWTSSAFLLVYTGIIAWNLYLLISETAWPH